MVKSLSKVPFVLLGLVLESDKPMFQVGCDD